MAVGGGYGASRRRSQLLWRVRYRYQGRARYQPAALFRAYREGHVPPYATNRAPSLCPDRREKSTKRRLRHRRSATVKTETGLAADDGSWQPDQDRHHSRPLSAVVESDAGGKPACQTQDAS